MTGLPELPPARPQPPIEPTPARPDLPALVGAGWVAAVRSPDDDGPGNDRPADERRARIAELFTEFMHQEGARDRAGDFADYLLDGLADADLAEADPPAISPLDSLALALAELVDARATIARVLRRLEDARTTDPGPATVHHHLDRAHRLINTAAERLARHNCGAAIAGALSASVTATIERGLSELRQSLERAGGAGTAGGRTDSVEAPQPAGYWPGAVEVQP